MCVWIAVMVIKTIQIPPLISYINNAYENSVDDYFLQIFNNIEIIINYY